MSKLLDILLRADLPNVAKELPECKCKVKRLSRLAGEDVVFTLRALPYGRVQEIKELQNSDSEIAILLSGMVDPDPKAKELKERYGGATPEETLKSILLPGEIVDLSREVERLSGYRMDTIERLKNG
jgi:hypothetical protein